MSKALTLHQPWASLIALGVKRIETRSWSTRYRGRLLIHAGLGYETLHCDAPNRDELWSSGSQRLIPPKDAAHEHEWKHGFPFRPLPFGVIVASCTLADVVPMVDHATWQDRPLRDVMDQHGGHVLMVDEHELGLWHRRPGKDGPDSATRTAVDDQRPYGDFQPGRYAWLLEDVKPTTERCPACWGAQWFAVTDDMEDAPDGAEVEHDGWGYHRTGGEWVPDYCGSCQGVGRCEPVPAKGKQGLWTWTPA